MRLPIADTSRIELVARIVNVRLRPCHASLIGGDRRSNPGSWRRSLPCGRASSVVSLSGSIVGDGWSSKWKIAERLAGRVADHERLVLLDRPSQGLAGVVSFVGEVQVFQKRAKSGDS